MSNEFGWRAYVEHDIGMLRPGIAVHLAERTGDRLRIVQPVDLTDVLVEDAFAAPSHPTPALRIPDDLARALLDALSAHYGGTSDTRTLRADFLHERGRVDRMIDALVRRSA